MKFLSRAFFSSLLVFTELFNLASQAQVLQMNYRTNKESGTLRNGPLEVGVKHIRRINEYGQSVVESNAIVKVDGMIVGKLIGPEWGSPATIVQIAEMDPSNPYPEVLLSSFTGGAHCCNQIKVLTSDSSGKIWKEVGLGPFDDGESPAKDPLQSGRYVVVDVDNRFLYRFASYAESVAPARIWELQGEKFMDVTQRPEFVAMHRLNLQKIAAWLKTKNYTSINGLLAAYVATKALVGELYEGWDLMMGRYDSSTDWGLKECKGNYDDRGSCVGLEVNYGSFPEALRAFLVETGYMSPTGHQRREPIKN